MRLGVLRFYKTDPVPVLEFETLVRVFFADGGTLEQLRATLGEVETTARAWMNELQAMISASLHGPYEFAKRLPINALALRFQLDYQELQADWARWATDGRLPGKTTKDENATRGAFNPEVGRVSMKSNRPLASTWK